MAYFHYIPNISCPSCEHKSNFDLLYATPYRKHSAERWVESSSNFQGLFVCSTCRNPLTMDIEVKERVHQKPVNTHHFLNKLNLSITEGSPLSSQKRKLAYTINTDELGYDLSPYFNITRTFTDKTTTLPQHLPSHIESMIIDDVLQVMGSAKFLIVACRSVLETACKDLLNEPSGKLVGMINQLKEDGFITQSIADWAHTIRKLGNEAVHSDTKPTQEEALELYNFTMTILELLYSYPARVKALRSD